MSKGNLVKKSLVPSQMTLEIPKFKRNLKQIPEGSKESTPGGQGSASEPVTPGMIDLGSFPVSPNSQADDKRNASSLNDEFLEHKAEYKKEEKEEQQDTEAEEKLSLKEKIKPKRRATFDMIAGLILNKKKSAIAPITLEQEQQMNSKENAQQNNPISFHSLSMDDAETYSSIKPKPTPKESHKKHNTVVPELSKNYQAINAINQGDLEGLKSLLTDQQLRKDIFGGMPMLHYAVRQGKADIVRYLCDEFPQEVKNLRTTSRINGNLTVSSILANRYDAASKPEERRALEVVAKILIEKGVDDPDQKFSASWAMIKQAIKDSVNSPSASPAGTSSTATNTTGKLTPDNNNKGCTVM